MTKELVGSHWTTSSWWWPKWRDWQTPSKPGTGNSGVRLWLDTRTLLAWLLDAIIDLCFSVYLSILCCQTNNPKNNDEKNMKTWVNSLKKHFQILDLLHCCPLFLSTVNPGLFLVYCINFAINKLISQRFYVGMENDINKGLQEAENQPPIYHLDVGCCW